jgi:hypothetical protein
LKDTWDSLGSSKGYFACFACRFACPGIYCWQIGGRNLIFAIGSSIRLRPQALVNNHAVKTAYQKVIYRVAVHVPGYGAAACYAHFYAEQLQGGFTCGDCFGGNMHRFLSLGCQHFAYRAGRYMAAGQKTPLAFQLFPLRYFYPAFSNGICAAYGQCGAQTDFSLALDCFLLR